MMMNNTNWKAIKLYSKFYFERGKEKNMASLRDGTIPLVSARKVNNGIKGFVSNPIKKLSGGNVITLNNDGDGGAGLAYFQPFNFGLDTHVTALHPKDSVSKDTLLFISVTISKQHSIFGHGRSISLARAKKLNTMVPVTIAHQPDYSYMEQYVKLVKERLINKYKNFLQSQLVLLKHVDIPKLANKKWSKFLVSNIFDDIQRGKRLKRSDQSSGNVPYVSSSGLNNGIDGFINREPTARMFKNCISLSNSGSVGKAFYEPFAFIASDHITHLKREKSNKYIYLFMTTALEKQKSNFNFNREINDSRIRAMRIMLPVSSNSEPDYLYMEQYIKNLMLKKYQQYLVFLNNTQQ